MIDKKLLKVARAIHVARLQDCYGVGEHFERALAKQPWPEDRKAFVRLQQNGQSWIETSIACAEAAIKTLNEANTPPRHMLSRCDGTIGYEQRPCKAVAYSDGTIENGPCDEPCRWVMLKEGEGNPPWSLSVADAFEKLMHERYRQTME